MSYPPAAVSSNAPTSGRVATRNPKYPGGALALVLALGACNADSLTMPGVPTEPVCYDSGCNSTGTSLDLDAPIIVRPLGDALTRIAPHLGDEETRDALSRALGKLENAVRSRDWVASRARLVDVRATLDRARDRMSSQASPTTSRDLADLTAIQLALIPASQALGVTGQ